MRLRKALTILLICAAAAPAFGGVETTEPLPGEDRFFTLVLAGAERVRYEALPEDQKERFRTVHWARLDPTPTTEINEIEMEHQRRVVAAIRRFRDMLGFFVWDDRSRAMIRFGEPDSINTSPDEAPVATALWVYADFALWFEDRAGNGVYGQGLAPLPAGGAEIRFDEVGGLPGEARYADVDVPDYSGSYVRVSAPVTAAKISTSFRENGLYARRGFRIVPRPAGVFRRGEPAAFYFEVYHVTADRDGRYYEEVTIRVEGGPGAAWTARFEGSARGELAPGRAATFGSVGREPDSGKSVTLDTTGLPPGAYTLVIEARDLTAEATDSARAAFTVTE